ncbi:helix-turn-helix domain-containing protein [Sphaerospermopsis aphanizomenoides BCCUSP55]|uniref:helix-turn-helix domain-containing protein n=1 Tax=Sphaerospermopsis aphanizomenoides TaxID=459663 RepID=UPI000A5D80B4|nr:RodZ domain-containing protein [Sphaerospermopsis aphanizomenoides]MBK1986661.1 helix-turn-helix domain-containing protein [Sphaerospermopsis aphanizomenoides BCCUSP55]
MKWLKRKNEKLSKPSIEQQQAEKLTQLGNKLAALREQQGLTLDEVVVQTRIPRRLLHAIEVGDLNDLPEPIYIQGLIRQFADALGLKGAEFASNFPVGYQQVSFQSNSPLKPIPQLRPVHLYLLYIFVIICSVNGLSQLLNQAALEANNGQNQQKLQKNSDLTVDKFPTQETQEIQVASNTTESQVVEIGVTLKSSSWIRVVADGKTEFEGVLPEGTHRNWKATEELTVKTDNAGGVLMSVNQQQPKQMGKPGKMEEIRIASGKVRS